MTETMTTEERGVPGSYAHTHARALALTAQLLLLLLPAHSSLPCRASGPPGCAVLAQPSRLGPWGGGQRARGRGGRTVIDQDSARIGSPTRIQVLPFTWRVCLSLSLVAAGLDPGGEGQLVHTVVIKHA